ncbi:M14 family zinc carboxypeptidase [Piscibacillus halophilus]|uniref:Chitobiase/beta-hexosaminidase C-terminal domain-containing protein n=1 Tax=Piscibacillus halophilus TaxID=571933 RepID=A0A1H9IQG9_9BACI|nr:M14 family zinc carboxypeptidase [Piscibacillus halophilus]SEQ76796.1 Chitobiase/beta-hexosaminidase C-terminal domain-containing protein [Piscibacillus halophilus]
MPKGKHVKHVKWLLLTSAVGLAIGSTYVNSNENSSVSADLEDRPVEIEDEPSQIVQLEVPSEEALDQLHELGIDLTHRAHMHDGEIEVDAVVTDSEIEQLKQYDITVKDVLIDEEIWQARVNEREEIIEQQNQIENAEENLQFLRANHFTNQSETFLYLEVKSSAGESPSTTLTADWEGNEDPVTLSRKSDYGEYLYHYLFIPMDDVPGEVTVTSNLGNDVTAKVTEWLGDDKPDNPKKHYATEFVDHYMDPYELNERMEQLAEEFPDLVEIIEMPHETNGYRRHAQATLGTMANSAVVVTSNAWGHEGGNDLSVELVAQENSSDLQVDINGDDITVQLETDENGEVVSTAQDVMAALNEEAGDLVSATPYRNYSGTGIVEPTSAELTDGLNAPEHISREPQTVKALRIGKKRDGSKPGVLGYAQEHAREWVTPLVTIEAAERLLRNYAHDGKTKQLVNNLDIFLVPSVNPDGATYSFYDYNWQRKNMTNHCPEELSDFGVRHNWGVDLNRNHSVGSIHDGYVGASTNCTSGTYAGPEEHSEPESQNLVWLADEFENIEFAMNIHSYGGYFMWSPGAYDQNREPLPRPTAGEEAFYWAASNHILSNIKEHRGTVILPSRTGPIPDVLYSAGGNSADYLWYEKGIYAWNFEVGADLWNEEQQRWQPVGFQPPYEEGHEEAMEFASGLIGLFEVAYQHSKDNKPPKSNVTPGEGEYDGPVELEFETSEPATIYYTLDGSRPTFESEQLQLGGTREPAETLTIDETTTVNWFAVDPAGNIEKNYNPLGNGQNYNSITLQIQE